MLAQTRSYDFLLCTIEDRLILYVCSRSVVGLQGPQFGQLAVSGDKVSRRNSSRFRRRGVKHTLPDELIDPARSFDSFRQFLKTILFSLY